MISVPEFKSKQIIIVYCNKGDKISFSNDNVVIKDNSGKIKHQSTCYKLFMLMIVGNTSITSGLLQRSKRFGFTICLMTPTMKPYQVINARGEGNTLLRKAQYEYDGLDVGKMLICNKLISQQSALKKIRDKSTFDHLAISEINKCIIGVRAANTVQQIMGFEGAGAKWYFDRIFRHYPWCGRKPRIKSDYINATMDIGYTVLFNYIEAILETFGFDVYYGVLHKAFFHRKSLVCDLIEPFRPIIDTKICKCLNLGQIRELDFEIVNRRWILPWKSSQKYTGLFLDTIVDYKEEIFRFIQSYYRCFSNKKSLDEYPTFRIH